MFFARYLLHSVLIIMLHILLLVDPAQGHEGTMTYENFYRLNKPLYRSSSGDLINFSYESAQVSESKKIDAFAMGDLRLYFQDNNALNYSLQEAYLVYQSTDYKLFIGRKILDWNINEKYWSLGYLNANQAFTLLSDAEEGVTGALFNKQLGAFEFDVLLSYVFIPQLNPSIDFKNGEVKSKSDWVRLPPRKTVINGVEVPIAYSISNYNVSKIIFNKSLGSNIRYRWSKGGVSAFAVYKPENKLRVNANASYDNVSKVIVEADPTVNHHAYYGLQIYHSFGDLKTRAGLSYVDPNARLGKDFPIDISNARKTIKLDYFTINPRYDKEAYSHMSANLDRKEYILSLNYIHLLTRDTRLNDDFFTDAIKWKRAIGGSITYFFNDSLNFLLDLKYDLSRFDNIVKSEMKYNFQNKITVALGLEMLKAPDSKSYWSYYRANDTLYSAVGFYF